jgi:transcriptional regulator with XRE-family HTH domain
MTLSEYVKKLVGLNPIIPTAKAIGISHGSLHRIMSGETEQPQIDTLKAIARYYGNTPDEQQSIYMTLMGLANYLTPQKEAVAQPEPPLTPDERQEQALRDTEARARAMGITEENELGTSRKRNSYP